MTRKTICCCFFIFLLSRTNNALHTAYTDHHQEIQQEIFNQTVHLFIFLFFKRVGRIVRLSHNFLLGDGKENRLPFIFHFLFYHIYSCADIDINAPIYIFLFISHFSWAVSNALKLIISIYGANEQTNKQKHKKWQEWRKHSVRWWMDGWIHNNYVY